jgi:hypothetical protein
VILILAVKIQNNKLGPELVEDKSSPPGIFADHVIWQGYGVPKPTQVAGSLKICRFLA